MWKFSGVYIRINLDGTTHLKSPGATIPSRMLLCHMSAPAPTPLGSVAHNNGIDSLIREIDQGYNACKRPNIHLEACRLTQRTQVGDATQRSHLCLCLSTICRSECPNNLSEAQEMILLQVDVNIH